MTTQQPEPKIRSAVYELLSLAFLYPKEGASTQLLDGARELRSAMTLQDRRPFGGLLDTLCGELQSCGDGGLESEYVEVFGHTLSTDCAPYESEYGQAHVFQKSHTLADLSAFYQAFGVSLNPELKDRLDHVSVEMEFMHLLTLKEAYARGNGHGEDKALLCRQAQEAFLANHLGTWIKRFADRVARKTGGSGVYGALVGLLEAQMAAEFRAFRLDPEFPGPPEPMESPEDDLDCNPFTADAGGRQGVAAR